MSSPEFPVGILYQGTKLIYEIPRRMKENVMRIYSGFNSDEYEGNDNEIEKQLTFHIKEAFANFLSYSQTAADIPFDALSYVIGELNYGGWVTDSLDRRLLLSLHKRFFSDDILNSLEFSFGNLTNLLKS